MRLKTKLSALSAIGIVLTLVVGFIGYHGIGEVTGTTTELKTSAQMIRYQMMADMMHDALRGDVLAAMQAKNDEEKKEVQTDLVDHAGTFRENVAKNLELKSSPAIRSALTDVGPALESYIKSAETIVGAAATDKAKAEELWPAFKEAFSVLEDRMEQLSDLMEKDAQAREESAQKTTRVATTAMLVAVVFAFIAMAFVTTFIARSITVPVQRMVHRVTDIAQGEGDLTQRIEADSNDELGDLGREFNLFMEKLQTMIGRVQKTAARLATASEQISASTDQISGDAQQQAASLEETSASLRQITEIVKHNADNATVASKIASESRTSADKGGQTVSSATHAMGEISVASKRVAEIITTIDEIAFQTNLLSLNAAVEAARAGEQGRGFAVVATEVRNLATRSGSAAKQIRELIQDSVAKVDTGSSLIHESGENLGGLLKSVNKVNDIIGEIAAASQEQANSIEQVGVAVRTMEQVTNRNNEQTVELAELARALASQATSLNELVGGFHVGVHNSDTE